MIFDEAELSDSGSIRMDPTTATLATLAKDPSMYSGAFPLLFSILGEGTGTSMALLFTVITSPLWSFENEQNLSTK